MTSGWNLRRRLTHRGEVVPGGSSQQDRFFSFFFSFFLLLLLASDSSNPTNNHNHKFNVNYSICHKTLISSSTVCTSARASQSQMCAGGHCCFWGFKVLRFLSGLAQQVTHKRHYMVSMSSLHQSSFIWSFDSPLVKNVLSSVFILTTTKMCSTLWFPE